MTYVGGLWAEWSYEQDRSVKDRWEHPRLGVQEIGSDDTWLMGPFLIALAIIALLTLWSVP